MSETRAMITRTERDRQGDAEPTELPGFHPTVHEAKAEAESIAGTHGHTSLSWKQFSPATWGLMSGALYTGILVSEVPAPQRAER